MKICDMPGGTESTSGVVGQVCSQMLRYQSQTSCVCVLLLALENMHYLQDPHMMQRFFGAELPKYAGILIAVNKVVGDRAKEDFQAMTEKAATKAVVAEIARPARVFAIDTCGILGSRAFPDKLPKRGTANFGDAAKSLRALFEILYPTGDFDAEPKADVGDMDGSDDDVNVVCYDNKRSEMQQEIKLRFKGVDNAEFFAEVQRIQEEGQTCVARDLLAKIVASGEKDLQSMHSQVETARLTVEEAQSKADRRKRVLEASSELRAALQSSIARASETALEWVQPVAQLLGDGQKGALTVERVREVTDAAFADVFDRKAVYFDAPGGPFDWDKGRRLLPNSARAKAFCVAFQELVARQAEKILGTAATDVSSTWLGEQLGDGWNDLPLPQFLLRPNAGVAVNAFAPMMPPLKSSLDVWRISNFSYRIFHLCILPNILVSDLLLYSRATMCFLSIIAGEGVWYLGKCIGGVQRYGILTDLFFLNLARSALDAMKEPLVMCSMESMKVVLEHQEEMLKQQVAGRLPSLGSLQDSYAKAMADLERVRRLV
mmetsp:Transcript_175757/g.558313  ORF Transcript_175757/g.558313 Transcript_175757/m.558313 type:complete len:546 (-) Transcript_175757:288-1925(-)